MKLDKYEIVNLLDAALNTQESHPTISIEQLLRTKLPFVETFGITGSDVDYYYPKIDRPLIGEFTSTPLDKVNFRFNGQYRGLADMCWYYAFTVFLVQVNTFHNKIEDIRMYYRPHAPGNESWMKANRHKLEEEPISIDDVHELWERSIGLSQGHKTKRFIAYDEGNPHHDTAGAFITALKKGVFDKE